MIISVPDKFLIEIESEKYFMRNNAKSNKSISECFDEIDDEYINSVKKCI